MKFRGLLICIGFSASVFAQDTLPEKHLKNITQLSFGGDNAEAYFSFNNEKLTLQVTDVKQGIPCDQIYMLDLMAKDQTRRNLISTGKGRTTCSYFMPGDQEILYASTHEAADSCPPPPAPRKDGKYLWPIYNTFDIYVADLKGNVKRKLTNHSGYDAEATVSPKGDLIVFTSDRSGDLELYTMNIDGSNVKQITSGLGYDGGAFFSPDGSKLVFRASRPQTPEAIAEYKELLSEGLVAPTNMELYTCNIDGSDLKQVTNLGKANWAPFFHPSGKKIIFSSNHASSRGYNFQLYMVNLDGSGLEQITFNSNFNAFPMFSPNGKKIVFSSNRNNGGTRDTNVFIADWVE
jgi:dipeptidyl aminopeptidase/acylaminoacyl peptidase